MKLPFTRLVSSILMLGSMFAPLVASAADEVPLRASAMKVVGTDNSPRVQITATNLTTKNIAGYTLVIQSVGADGSLGPKFTHTEVFAFTPAMRNSAFPEGLKPSAVRKSSSLKAPLGPDSKFLEKYTATPDYILFQDGSEWGADTLRSSQKIYGMLRGWQMSHGYLKDILDSKGVGALTEELGR